MKFKILILTLISSTLFLSGCTESNEKITSKDLIFLEKTNAHDEFNLIFESEQDKKYYVVIVDNYTYDKLELDKGDILTLDAKSKPNPGVISLLSLSLAYGNDYIYPKESVLIFDNWKSLYILRSYTTNEEEN